MSDMVVFDIDGVLTDFVNEVFIPTARDVLQRDIDQVCQVTQQHSWGLTNIVASHELPHVWTSPLLIKYIMLAKPIPKMVDLFNNTPNSVLITARGTHDWHDIQSVLIREATSAWLPHIGVTPRPVFFSNEKVPIADGLKATLAYEDRPETVLAYIEQGIRVRMPVYGYNKHIEHPLVERMESWGK